MSITFPTNSNMVLSNQVEDRVGNTSKTLFDMTSSWTTDPKSNKQINQQAQFGPVSDWVNIINQDGSYSDLLNSYMKQTKMATYYQDNPLPVLEHSRKYGYQGPELGGAIRR